MTQGMEITIARATPDDLVGIQEVIYRGWLATYPNAEHRITVDDIEDRFKGGASEENIARGREQMANPPAGQIALVARDAASIVRFCRATAHPNRNQLYAIYVLPDYHGRGIGAALWQRAQQHLDAGKHTIVQVAVYNAKAIRFYASFGFVDTGRRISNLKFRMRSGAMIPELEMRRSPDQQQADCA